MYILHENNYYWILNKLIVQILLTYNYTYNYVPLFFFCIIFQGVIEFAMALFFAKLVAYTFLFWLPYYVTNTS